MSERKKNIPGECPSPFELGNSGWNILHSSAAVYPYKPTPEQKEAMKNFIYGWSHVYACNWCAYHMRQHLKEHPPVVDNKIAVSRYICEFHNVVNEHLGKDQFSCDANTLLKRWHPGYPDRMDDHPSMEEQVEAERLRMKEEKEQEQRQQNSSSSSPLSTSPSSSPSGLGGNKPSQSINGWRSWQGGSHNNNNNNNNNRLTENGSSENVAKHNDSNNKTGESTSVFKKWFSRGGNGEGQTHAKALGGDAALKNTGKAADNETDVDAVLARLKRCQVYCPEDEELGKKH